MGRIIEGKSLDEHLVQEFATLTKKYRLSYFFRDSCYDGRGGLKAFRRLLKEIEEETRNGYIEFNGLEMSSLKKSIEKCKSLSKESRFALVDVIYDINKESTYKLSFYRNTVSEIPDIVVFSSPSYSTRFL